VSMHNAVFHMKFQLGITVALPI
jgi:hypothetical protein